MNFKTSDRGNNQRIKMLSKKYDDLMNHCSLANSQISVDILNAANSISSMDIESILRNMVLPLSDESNIDEDEHSILKLTGTSSHFQFGFQLAADECPQNYLRNVFLDEGNDFLS